MGVLSDVEELGLKIVILARNGELSAFDCGVCNVAMQEKRNCELIDSDNSVFYHNFIGEVSACPLRLIPTTILEFIDELDYLDRFPSSAPKYEEVNHRFWETVKLYDRLRAEYQQEKAKTDANTQDNLVKFREIAKR